ncbi:MAG: ABC transporter substrate-binding protein [Desulfomonilaceae bacterium]|nr:ABC transporter substrate-binding protein [Desulfomonilaceae bacterium]
MRTRILLLGLAFVLICSTAFAADEIRVGSINDLTGATSDVGKDAALGIRECVQYLNDTGGIEGKKIKLFLYDYGYRVPEAITIYKRFRDYDKISLLLQWGTGDTEALSPTVNRDKMVTISDSLSGHLCDPKKTPYNFVYSTDYSTNARAALTVWFEEVWKKSDKWKKDREAGKKPKLVCFYMFAAPYASAPIKAIKDQAKLLGMEVGKDQDVSLTALDAKSQVLGAKQEHPNVIWHGNTTMSVATAVKDAYALKLGADHIVNNWGFDKNLIRMTGEAGEGVIGAAACAFLGMDVPYMDKVLEYCKKVNPGVPIEKRDIRTVQAWLKVSLAAAGLSGAIKQGKLDGPTIKGSLESLKGWYPFNKENALGRGPYTITDTDHRPTPVALLYHIKDGKIALLSTINMQEKFPKEWPSWLGW